VIMYFMQIAPLLLPVSLGDVGRAFLGILGMNLEGLSSGRGICLGEDVTPRGMLTVYYLPVVLTLLWMCLWTFTAQCVGSRGYALYASERLQTGFALLVLSGYSTFAEVTMRMLTCIKIPSAGWVIFEAGNSPCHDLSWWLAMGTLLLCILPAPFAVFAIARWCSEGHDQAAQHVELSYQHWMTKWALVFRAPYREGAELYEFVVMVRRLVLLGLSAFLAPVVLVRAILLSVVLIVIVIIDAIVRPFSEWHDQANESLSLFLLSVLSLFNLYRSSLVAHGGTFSPGNDISTTEIGIVITPTVTLVGLLAYKLWILVKNRQVQGTDAKFEADAAVPFSISSNEPDEALIPKTDSDVVVN